MLMSTTGLMGDWAGVGGPFVVGMVKTFVGERSFPRQIATV